MSSTTVAQWCTSSTSECTVLVSADSVARAGAFLDYSGRMLARVTAGLAIGPAEADIALRDLCGSI